MMPKDKSSGKKLADMMYGNPKGAAFGVFPQMKAKRSKQDPEAAKNFPVDLARGVLAGAVGMPGDIESLARLPYELMTGNESPTFLPTSEDILRRIPFGSDTPASQFASGLGTLAGGSANIGAAPRMVKRGALAAGRAGERMAEKVVPGIMERGGAGADILSGLAQGSRSQIFIGPKAKTFNQSRADMAVAMEEAGRTPQEIWLATGTFRGKDGILRQEIDDRAAKFLSPDERKERLEATKSKIADMKEKIKPTPQKDLFPKALTEAKKEVRDDISILQGDVKGRSRNPRTQGLLAQYIFEHPELYAAYPELQNVNFVTEGGSGNTLGALSIMPSRGYYPGSMEIDIYDRGLRNDPTSTSLHEMQHAVQTLEGMGPGGNPTFAFSDPKASEMLQQERLKMLNPLPYEDFVRQGGYTDMEQAGKDYAKYTKNLQGGIDPAYDRMLQQRVAMEYYKRLLGEAEARAVQDRQMMTPLQRMETPPPASYDVPQEDLIVKPPREYADGGRVHISDNPDVMQLEMAGGGLVKGLKAAVKTAKAGADAPKPIVEAPSIIIPSKIQNVREAVRKSEGNYGAKRVERAADEIRNLERMYTEKALRDAFTGDSAKAVVTMNPADFEKYANMLIGRTQEDIGPKMRELGKMGDINKHTVPTEEYIQHLMRVQGGFDQVPYLNLYKDEVGLPSYPEIKGHEGRHRNRALAAQGEESSLVQISPRGDLREGLPRRSQEEYIEALKEELGLSNQLVYPEADPYRPPIRLPEPYAEGGEVSMAAGGLAKAAKALKAAKEAPMKASEALGRVEGRPLIITQADRTKVGGGYLGGPGFSGLQLTEPEYRAAEAAWGVKTPGVAKMILGGGKAAGKDPVYAAMLGTPTQHQSNQMVFDKLYNDFKKSAKKGNLDQDLRDRINMRLANTVDKEGNPIFPPDVDILGKNFKELANTFDRRAVTANLIGGMGVGGKKGQIIDYDKIIRETTDPLLLDAPTGALGNRLFTLSGGIIERPDLHPAFPTILQGEDLGVSFDPVARELIMKDFMERTMREKGRTPGYMDYTRGYPPSQLITEDLLTELQKMGKKAGGAVRKAAGGEVHGLSNEDLLFLQNQEDLAKLPAHVQREAIVNMGGQELRQRMSGKYAAGGEITADDLILEERKLP